MMMTIIWVWVCMCVFVCCVEVKTVFQSSSKIKYFVLQIVQRSVTVWVFMLSFQPDLILVEAALRGQL